MSNLEHVLAINNRLGEGPLWHPQEQALYWVDIEGYCFYRLWPSTMEYEVFDVGFPLGALAFRASGGVLLASQKGFSLWDFEANSQQFMIDPEADQPRSRFNDGAVDRNGRFWAGTLGKKGFANALYRLNSDYSVQKMETEVGIANGLGWSPDNKTMYFTDSPLGIIYAYDYDAANGTIENRRPFVQVPECDGVPDGLTVDQEGFVWSAHWNGWRVTRYDPDGKVEQIIQLPVQNVTSCTFGGAELNELYITTAKHGISEAALMNQPLAGDLFRIKVKTKGVEEPMFLG